MTPQITVAIPTFKTPPELLDRCIRSVLASEGVEVRVLVLSDCAEEPEVGVRDDRLLVRALGANRGVYFARAVALGATSTEYHAVVDADDFVDPSWLASLAQFGVDAAWNGEALHHRPNGEIRTARFPARGGYRGMAELFHFTDHHGLYRTSALEAVGGYHPGFRMGYDTLMVALMAQTHLFGWSPASKGAAYHRMILPTSLTNAPATGMRSSARAAVRRRLVEMYGEVLQAAPSVDELGPMMRGAWPARLAERVMAATEGFK